MNDKLYLMIWLFALVGLMVSLLAACSVFWRVFYAVKDFIRGKRKTPESAAQKRSGKAA
ncbi:hypothetical protein [Massiliimalia timonensis]|uniref:hypothetical protein n=1 Tax=Massiliimalia timonensis TaxID=1987501 RepID=UPI00189F9034|nr:hypothetical protein [Massiliimalia timonensis]